MSHPSSFLALLALAGALAIGSPTDVLAADSDGIALPTPLLPHIRTVDPRLRVLIDDAVRSSSIVRALVARISSSDVIVYIDCERDPAARRPGRLNFVTYAGGYRYLVIRLKPKARISAIAMLAHELQHAAEIADIPSIVDDQSLARAYIRIGYRSHTAHGVAFDTKAAVETGRRVKEEMEVAETAGPVSSGAVRSTD